MKRPKNVPANWQHAPCVSCKRTTWFDPTLRESTLARGLSFSVVCSASCAMKAVQQQERRTP